MTHYWVMFLVICVILLNAHVHGLAGVIGSQQLHDVLIKDRQGPRHNGQVVLRTIEEENRINVVSHKLVQGIVTLAIHRHLLLLRDLLWTELVSSGWRHLCQNF